MTNPQIRNIGKLELLLDSILKKAHSIPTKKMACKDVTFAQMKVIRFLKQYQQAPMKDIAGALGVTLPTATGLVDTLVHNRYLKRHHETSDRRLVHVELSSKGYRLLDTFSKMQRDWFTRVRDSMTPANWGRFIEALETIDTLLNEMR